MLKRRWLLYWPSKPLVGNPQNTMLKKVTTIVLVVSVAAVATYFAWRIFAGGIATPNPNNNNIGGPDAEKASTRTLTLDPVFDFWIHKASKDIYSIAPSGQIIRVGLSPATSVSVTSQPIPELGSINPSLDGSSVIIKFGHPNQPSFSIFEIGKKEFRALPAGITSADWHPILNNRIVFLKNNGGVSQLATLDTRNNKILEVVKINQKDLLVEWVTEETFHLHEKPSSDQPTIIWSYDSKTKTFSLITKGESPSMLKWWPEKGRLLKWAGGKLTLADKNNHEISTINLSTAPDKCFLGEPIIYCSAPRDQYAINQNKFFRAALMRDYRGSASETIYEIFSLSAGSNRQLSASPMLSSGEIEQIGGGLRSVKVEKNGDALIVLSGQDRRLYGISL
ncbi:MAG: hypothetical protein G01um101419_576 [Parcubacteria group bacterium Gr01-1014_19]|nr:MAG: hypothetical protein G01um101419_576 [Parcubacteria group bacterium Gr01-1014_19]